MTIYKLRNIIASLACVLAISSLQAQFDDVYYDPDQFDPSYHYVPQEIPTESTEEGITYYDNDEYDNYEDYDYYY